MKNIQLQDLDWAVLWQQAREKKNWRRKGAADWDKKAVSFARRTSRSVYTEKFLQLLAPEKEWSILDIGCGPGTLALPLANSVKRITALDFSEKMLAILDEKAAAQSLTNITTCKLSWQDDWHGHGIAAHDIAIASRSMAVPDIKQAILRLNSFATTRVCITDRVKHGPMDPSAYAAVDRKLNSGPDYIYTVNLLYQMGFLPTVSYIQLEEALEYPSVAEAFSSYSWMFPDLSSDEEKRLQKYVRSITTVDDNGTAAVHRQHVPTWAFISWQPGTP